MGKYSQEPNEIIEITTRLTLQDYSEVLALLEKRFRKKLFRSLEKAGLTVIDDTGKPIKRLGRHLKISQAITTQSAQTPAQSTESAPSPTAKETQIVNPYITPLPEH